MLIIPCPKEVSVSTELNSGLGRRLPCYDINESVIIVKDEEKSPIPVKGGFDEGSLGLKEKSERLIPSVDKNLQLTRN